MTAGDRVVTEPAAAGISAWRLWRRWVVANVVGEIIGFGLAAGIGAAAMGLVGRLEGAVLLATTVGLIVAVGLVEGLAVGVAQWLVLRRPLPRINAVAWIGATVAGAIVAWGAGMAIGQNLGDQLGQLARGSPVLLAALIGLVAGTLLSGVQWLVLRSVTGHAGWWVPAHAAGWSAAMVVAFAGMGAIPDDATIAVWIAGGGAVGLAMGVVAAAVSGLALIAAAAGGTRPTAGAQ
jgi:hypothetical protein